MGFDFILYRHGPFSFNLRDELAELRAVGYLELEPRPQPYGPSFAVTTEGRKLVQVHEGTVNEYAREIAFVTERLADKNVADLERLATAFFLVLRDGKGDESSRARALHEVKRHVSEEEALEAVRTVDLWVEESSVLPH